MRARTSRADALGRERCISFASYKRLFSAPELVRDLIMDFVPDEWLHSLDYGTLEKVPGSYVADDLRHHADDVVWRVKAEGEWIYLYILIEFPPESR